MRHLVWGVPTGHHPRMRLAGVTGCILVSALGCGGTNNAGTDGGSTGSAESSTGTPDPTTEGSSSGAADGSSSTSGNADSSSTGDGESSTTGSETTGGAPDAFEAGFDVTEISPNEGHLALNVYMGAYGAPFLRGPAESVHDDVYIRSFAVGIGEEGFVAAVADLPGMGNDFTQAIRARVAADTGLPPEHVMIGTTHTHSGPDFQGLWGGGPSEYRDPVIDEIVGSMNRAWLLRAPATLEVASTTAPNSNRRDWPFTDDSVTLLLAHDERGALMGSVGVFAAHPTVLGQSNLAISRDWCGGYVDTMEEQTGAPSVLFAGILGDASASTPPGEYADGFERAFAYGALIADEALAVMPDAEPVSTGLVIDHVTWTMPVENALFQIAAALDLLDYSFSEEGDGQTVDTLGAYVRLGEQLQFVTFPGEPLTRAGLEIKEAMTAPHRAVLGQTGDSLGYFIPSDEWMTGRNDDYEETVALHESAGDTAVEALVGLVEDDRF